ncbi:type II toxin-antitoxin system YafQ family toxin [Candidatus Peregrinibacteria bacterium]|nr:type II toxin-antitoxin system YafQ family toxin [Candidatus Peregrinibacteria bacterium]
MRIARFAKRFRRDYAKAQRSGKNISKLDTVMHMLVDGVFLPSKYKDHALHGVWQDMRDCHIEGNWVLVYELAISDDGSDIIIFHATDTHENIFG